MATIENRSNYIVSVRNRDDLTRSFQHDKTKPAQAYLATLAQQGFRPQLQQLDDKFFVRIRDKGYRSQSGMLDSLGETERFIKMVELDRARGLGRDYPKARSVTLADLVARYMRDEGPKLKSWESVGKYQCAKLLRGGTGNFNARDRKAMAKALGVPVDKLPARLEPDYP